VRIETPDGEMVERLPTPRASFAGFAMETHLSDPQLAYFAGYTMWTYLTSPFILAQPGVVAEEIAPWSEDSETWRRLRVAAPTNDAKLNMPLANGEPSTQGCPMQTRSQNYTRALEGLSRKVTAIDGANEPSHQPVSQPKRYQQQRHHACGPYPHEPAQLHHPRTHQ
jgi:hypothetical protein